MYVVVVSPFSPLSPVVASESSNGGQVTSRDVGEGKSAELRRNYKKASSPC